MRNRNISFLIRLSEKEYERLQKNVQATGLSREAFIRALFVGYKPKPLPPLDYFSLLRELHAIGNSLNQLAAKANATGHMDKAIFQYEANRLRKTVQEIQEAFTAPERRMGFGDDSNMGCARPP
jgi:hypothetical protein